MVAFNRLTEAFNRTEPPKHRLECLELPELTEKAFELAEALDTDQLMQAALVLEHLAADPKMVDLFGGEAMCQLTLGGAADWLTTQARERGE